MRDAFVDPVYMLPRPFTLLLLSCGLEAVETPLDNWELWAGGELLLELVIALVGSGWTFLSLLLYLLAARHARPFRGRAGFGWALIALGLLLQAQRVILKPFFGDNLGEWPQWLWAAQSAAAIATFAIVVWLLWTVMSEYRPAVLSGTREMTASEWKHHTQG